MVRTLHAMDKGMAGAGGGGDAEDYASQPLEVRLASKVRGGLWRTDMVADSGSYGRRAFPPMRSSSRRFRRPRRRTTRCSARM